MDNIHVVLPPPDSDNLSKAIVSLMQKGRREAKDEDLAIGYKIYQIIDPATPKLLSADFFIPQQVCSPVREVLQD